MIEIIIWDILRILDLFILIFIVMAAFRNGWIRIIDHNTETKINFRNLVGIIIGVIGLVIVFEYPLGHTMRLIGIHILVMGIMVGENGDGRTPDKGKPEEK